MVKINFLDKTDNLKVIEAKEGSSLLDVAKKNNIDLEGSCGGDMLCSTCHVYILSKHLNKLKKQTIILQARKIFFNKLLIKFLILIN